MSELQQPGGISMEQSTHSALVGHYCHYICPDAKLLIFQRLRQDRKWSKKGMTEMLHVQQFWKSTHFGKNDLFEGVRVKKMGKIF